ncbi:hypothetical protein BJV78DRAFT_1158008 [Lactifluus subvellereus]|nr:hypothetical protein BJV78DRAFT_1158008 [Lactifluus subvellereus]
MDADYSNLFAAGLRVIESRSSSYLGSSVSSSSPPDNEDVTAPNKIPSWKTFHFPTRLWRCPSPRNEKTPAADPSLNAACDVKPKPARRRSMSGGVVEETALDVQIWDWSTRVHQATSLLGEEDECVDPYLHKVDPVDTPSSAILVKLPSYTSLAEHNIPATQPLSSRQSQRDRRVSVQTLPVYMMLPTQPYRSSLEKGAVWESESVSSSDDESGMDDDWRQFRVEWIDFDGDH